MAQRVSRWGRFQSHMYFLSGRRLGQLGILELARLLLKNLRRWEENI